MKQRILCMILSIAIIFISVDISVFATVVRDTIDTVSGNDVEKENVNETLDVTSKEKISALENNLIGNQEEMSSSDISAIAMSTENAGKCGENLNWKIEGTTLIISGEGAMYDYEEDEENNSTAPWIPYKSSLTTLELENGITYIGNEAFSGCWEFKGTLKLPDTVTTIGESAFQSCNGFTGISFSNNLKEIGKYGFLGCSSVNESLNFPEGLESIGYHAFDSCFNITGDLIIPSTVTYIGDFAFYSCKGLSENLYIKSPSLVIGEKAFWTNTITTVYGLTGTTAEEYATSEGWNFIVYDDEQGSGETSTLGQCGDNLFWELENGIITISGTGRMYDYESVEATPWYSYKDKISGLIFEEGITHIGSFAFQDFVNITGSLDLPQSLISIEQSVFKNCTGFNGNLTFGDSLETIANFAFEGCSGFTGGLMIPDSVQVIGTHTFARCSSFTGELVIGKNINTIANYTFKDCIGVNRITFKGTVPEVVGNNIFENVIADVYYPTEDIAWEAIVGNNYGGTLRWLNTSDALVQTKKKITVSGDMILDAGEGKIVIENIVWNYGSLTIKGQVEFLNNVSASTSNSRAISSSLILEEGADVTINGNLDVSLSNVGYGSAISLNVKPNSRLHIKGNLLAYKNGNGMQGYWYPRITLNGNVEIDGNLDVQGEYVHMNYENSYVLIKGDYKQEIGRYWGEYWWKECYLTSGVLEVKGDFLYDSAGASDLGGNHIIVFSGEKVQNVRGIFKNVRVENLSSAGVVFYDLIQGGFSADGTRLPTQIWGSICVDMDAKISGSTVSSMLKNPVVNIEVIKLPNKCLYMPGEIFDSSGMELLVTYQNGVRESTFGGWTSSYKCELPYESKNVEITFGEKKANITVYVVPMDVGDNVIIKSLSPIKGQENVVVSGEVLLKIEFEGEIKKGNGFFYLMDAETNQKLREIDVKTDLVKIGTDNKSLELKVKSMPYGKKIYVLADDTTVALLDGEKWRGIDNAEQWFFFTEELIYSLENLPIMTEQEAREFLGFVSNNSSMLDKDIKGTTYYKILTGTYDGSEKEYFNNAFALYQYIVMNIQSHELKSNTLSEDFKKTLINYLEEKIGGIEDVPGEDVYNKLLNQELGKIEELFVNVGCTLASKAGIYITEDMLDVINLSKDIYGSILELPKKIEEFVRTSVTVVKTIFIPLQDELKGRYEYFNHYIEVRKRLNPSDALFTYELEAKTFELRQETGMGALMNCIPNVSSWVNNTDKINGWAEYTFHLMQALQNGGVSTEFQKGRYTIVEIQCPVDVYIWDENKNLVAVIKNNQVEKEVSKENAKEVNIQILDDVKKILIGGDGYQIEMKAYSEGEMNYIVRTVDENYNTIVQKNYYSIPLIVGKEFTSYGNSNYTELFLVEDGNESIVDVSEEGNLPVQNIEVIGSEGGNVFGNGQYSKGTYVILNALAKEGYEFVGWYIEGKLISEKGNYGFSAMNDMKIIGKFKKRDNFINAPGNVKDDRIKEFDLSKEEDSIFFEKSEDTIKVEEIITENLSSSKINNGKNRNKNKEELMKNSLFKEKEEEKDISSMNDKLINKETNIPEEKALDDQKLDFKWKNYFAILLVLGVVAILNIRKKVKKKE